MHLNELRIAVLLNDRMALPAVTQLLQAGAVVAVGMADKMSEVRMVTEAMCHEVHVPLQFFNKKELAKGLNEWLGAYKPDVVFVKTFPWLIPEEVLHIPKLGFINFHYALLPEQRGGNPIFWAIRNRAEKGGVTVHKMDGAYDTGAILFRHEIPINEEDSFGMYTSQLAYAGAAITGQLLQAMLAEKTLPEMIQDDSKAMWYKRPRPEDLVIDWDKMSRDDIRALVNACNPWNKGAATSFKGWRFAICDTTIAGHKIAADIKPGTIVAMDERQGMVLACKEQKALCIESVYCEEGIMAGYKLGRFGVKVGMVFS